MDGEGSGLRAWLIDLAAALIAGAAVGACGTLFGEPMAALPAAAGAFLLSFALLQCVPAGDARYSLPAFSLPDWTDVLREEPLELTDLEPLLLDTPLRPAEGSGVIRLFPMTPLPTAGELKRRIDAHLQQRAVNPEDDDKVVLLSPDASAALRSALSELKRSLR